MKEVTLAVSHKKVRFTAYITGYFFTEKNSKHRSLTKRNQKPRLNSYFYFIFVFFQCHDKTVIVNLMRYCICNKNNRIFSPKSDKFSLLSL